MEEKGDWSLSPVAPIDFPSSSVSRAPFTAKNLVKARQSLDNNQDINNTLRYMLTAGNRSTDSGVLQAVAFSDRWHFWPDFAEDGKIGDVVELLE